MRPRRPDLSCRPIAALVRRPWWARAREEARAGRGDAGAWEFSNLRFSLPQLGGHSIVIRSPNAMMRSRERVLSYGPRHEKLACVRRRRVAHQPSWPTFL